MLELYQMPISHYCEKVRWALDYKTLDYKTVNLLPGLHVKTAKKLTQRSSVPILVHDGKAITESSHIITWLDNHYPERSLTPENKSEAEQALEWEKFADEEIGIHVRRLCYQTLLDHPDIVIPFFCTGGPWYSKLVMNAMYPKLSERMRELMKINQDTTQISEQKVRTAIDKIYAHLEDREFMVGDQFSRADLACGALLAPLITPDRYGLDWPETLPSPLKEVVESYRPKLGWLEKLYKDYR